MTQRSKKFILWFSELGMSDVPLVGGKNASLGEMYRKLVPKGVDIPDGFAITSYAYRYFLKTAGIENKIKKILSGLDIHDIKSLSLSGFQIRQTILRANLPRELEEETISAYKKLSKIYKEKNTDVAVRSSATAEDLPSASFAGQQETYLNIQGEYALLDAVKKCFASLFTNRAISYREDKGFDHLKVFLSVGIQKMVRSDVACAGVIFSCDTETGFRNVVLIDSSYGLGESVVKGEVNPDEYYVFKPTLKKGFKPIIGKKLGSKKTKIVYSIEGNQTTRHVQVSGSDRKKYTLKDNEVLLLAKWASLIEDYYSKKAGRYMPMDIEWAKDGQLNKLFIVQARPETIHAVAAPNILEEYMLERKGKVLVEGLSIGSKIGQGKAHIIKDVRDINKFKKGEVLITEITDPDWEPIMKIAKAIVTNSGGRTSHAAIVSRELGIPCIVGTKNSTEKINSGQNITVSCAEGEIGQVYSGLLPFRIKKTRLDRLSKTKTQIMMNIGDPEQAFSLSSIPCDGVGLARVEFIFTNYIKIHPLALINFKTLKDKEVKEKISKVTYGYSDKKEFFVDKLAQGISRIAASFYPKEVIVRTTDFKSSEYAGLIGGESFEPEEGNPMLGFRGAARYLDKNYQPAFRLECQALKKVREDFGLKNLKIMIPFCRTIEEGKDVLNIMEEEGLIRGKDGLEIYVMCEVPSNVILADEFSKIFDGFSIGTNDLTQLTLGVDRDSELVSRIFDERNEAVKRFVREVIETAHKYKRKVGICGQAPSDYPEFAEYLVDLGIDSMSINSDTVLKTMVLVSKKERRG